MADLSANPTPNFTPNLTSDAAAMAAIHATSFDRPWTEIEFEELLAGGAFAVAEPGGFIMVRVAADEAEVLTLAVEPERRRQGIGLALIRSACHEAERHGAEAIFLEVALDNEAALKVREAAGAWTESYPAMEYRHGPISVTDEHSLTWFFGTPPEGLPEQVAATGALAEASGADAMADLVRVQRLAVALAEAKGLDPDRPRNLTRSIILS